MTLDRGASADSNKVKGGWVFLVTFLTISSWSFSAFSVPNREQVITQLRASKSRIENKIKNSESKITQLLNSTMALELNAGAINGFNQSLKSLLAEKADLVFKQNLFDRLTNRMDIQFKGGDLRSVLVQEILTMAQNEALDNGQPQRVQFLSYLSLALRTLPEPYENLITFIEGYLESSTLNNPRDPLNFLNLRHYTNGAVAVIASPIPRESVGDIVGSPSQTASMKGAGEELPKTVRQPIRSDVESQIPGQ